MTVDHRLLCSMRPFLAAALASVATIAPIAIYRAGVVASGGPRLEVSQSSVYFGALGPGVQATRAITLKNAGRGTLILQHVQASCACTEIKLDRESLGPGETARLRVTMKGKVGGANAQLRIACNDPARPLTIIPITSSDGRSVVAEPEFVEFRGHGRKSDTLPVVVRLLYRDAQELETKGVPRVRSTSGAIDVNQPTQLDSRTLVFSVGVNQPLLRGIVRGAVVVENPAGEALQIPVTVYVPGEHFLPLPAIVVNGTEGRRNHVLKLHHRAGASQPAKLSVRTDAGRWNVQSHYPLDRGDCPISNLEVTLSPREARRQLQSPEFPDGVPADHLIVDVLDEAGQLLESIWVPISDRDSI